MTNSTSAIPGADPADRPTVHLMPGGHRRAVAGHPWLYSNEILMDQRAKALTPGTIVRLVAEHGEAIGAASFNPHSLIAARLISRAPEVRIDPPFLADRLRRALGLRERIVPAPFYRLVHAEADGLPGLIVDRYGDALVVQANSAGMECLTPLLIEALEMVLAPEAVLLRNDSVARAQEGLPSETSWVKGGPSRTVDLIENGARFPIELGQGQKTGWFFDQRENRAMVAALAGGARLLDLYCYGGGFAVQAACAGACEVLAVDRSEPALVAARRAAEANRLDGRCRFERAEAFDRLQRLRQAGERFDILVADPPAFVKSKRELAQGAKGYRKLVRLAAPLINEGGFLFVASCSHHVDPPLFAEQVRRGLLDANRGGRILASTGAGKDHPVHPALPESAYLKAQLLQID
ncbi:MAG TPA: class I SAM-dependent rRNA methyltransferase [Alphaproteobacteria bacterium]|nr:class I SAM-dependent rRNA methyltransferase [Alphaproteobacteria bacterium]